MSNTEMEILLRVEKKVDNLDKKFDETMIQYIIPHNEYINNLKDEKKESKKKKNNKLAHKITLGIAIFNGLLAVCIAIIF